MSTTTESVQIDSRKFMRAINNSAQAKVHLFESLVKKLAKKTNSNWQLAALNGGKIFIEDLDTGKYLMADHARAKGGRVTISNVRPVQIVESQKQNIFENACGALITAIEKNDQRGMRTAFNNLAHQRFSPRTIPESGVVKTQDGVVRNVVVESDETVLSDRVKAKLISALVESVSDTVILENGSVVSATFGKDAKRRIPISEWTCRKVVGNHMRDVAKKAWLSEGFQKRIYNVARLVGEDKIKEAVAFVKDFLAEEQEFCLLTRDECQTLIDNTLAARAVLNEQLCTDVATLIFRTNLAVNRDTILKEWAATAKKAQHPTLLENVNILERAKDFEGAYEKFLNLAFNEALSPRDEEINAYRTALSLLRDNSRLSEDNELSSKVDELITKLEDPNVDDATVHLVRETLAGASKELSALENLGSYDEIPGEGGGEEFGEDLGEELGDEVSGEQPAVVINAPLIQIGGSSGAAEDELGLGGEDLGGDLGEPDLGGEDLGGEPEELGDDLGLGDEGEEDFDLGGEEEDELEGLDLGEEEEPRNRRGPINISLDSKQKAGKKSVNETVNKALGKDGIGEDKDWFKKNVLSKGKDDESADTDDSDDSDDTDDSDDNPFTEDTHDPYSFSGDVNFETGVGSDYGQPAILGEMSDVVTSMFNIAEQHEYHSDDIVENVNDLAVAAIKANGIRIPQHKVGATVDAVVDAFYDRAEALGEDQYKFGTIRRRRGMPKSDLRRNEADKKGRSTQGVSQGPGFTGEAPKNDAAGISGSAPQTEGDTGFTNEPSHKSGISGSPPKTEDNSGFSGDKPVAESVAYEQIVWLEHDQQNQGIKGDLNGVRFILDYASPPCILSEDGSVEVPIPEEITQSALRSASLIEGRADNGFHQWLSGSIEQFRPITSEEDKELQEAVATITAQADGTISVAVDADVAVDEMGGEMGEPGMDGEMGDEVPGEVPDAIGGAMGDTEEIPGDDFGGEEGGMQPVTDIDDEVGEVPAPGEEPGAEAMPDFEGPDATPEGPEPPAAPVPPEGGEDEEVEEDAPPVATEDKDMTDPSKAAYDTTTDDHRKSPENSKTSAKPPKKNDGKNLDGFSTTPEKGKMGDKATADLKPVKPGKNRPK